MKDRITAFFLAVLIIAGSAVTDQSYAAGSWTHARELSMRLKEAGRASEAYQAALSYDVPSNGENMFDREFVAGWIALRDLERAKLALAHFTKMSSYVDQLPSYERGQGRAKTGYWLGRTLHRLGRDEEARQMYKAARAYGTTFYGQLSASELGAPLSPEQVKSIASNYPVKDIYWHDTRVRRELVLAVIREESRFKQSAVSHAAAIGMMQVLDDTARFVGRQAGVKVDIGLMRESADYNIAVGSRYLGDLLEQFSGNSMLSAAAYNAGPGRVIEWLERFGDPRGGAVDPVDWAESIPFKETREYVQKVMSSYVTYMALAKS